MLFKMYQEASFHRIYHCPKVGRTAEIISAGLIPTRGEVTKGISQAVEIINACPLGIRCNCEALYLILASRTQEKLLDELNVLYLRP